MKTERPHIQSEESYIEHKSIVAICLKDVLKNTAQTARPMPFKVYDPCRSSCTTHTVRTARSISFKLHDPYRSDRTTHHLILLRAPANGLVVLIGEAVVLLLLLQALLAEGLEVGLELLHLG